MKLKHIRNIISSIVTVVTYLTIIFTSAVLTNFNLLLFALLWIPVYIVEIYYRYKTNIHNDLLYALNILFMMGYNGIFIVLILRTIVQPEVFTQFGFYFYKALYLISVFTLVKYIKLYNKGW